MTKLIVCLANKCILFRISGRKIFVFLLPNVSYIGFQPFKLFFKLVKTDVAIIIGILTRQGITGLTL